MVKKICVGFAVGQGFLGTLGYATLLSWPASGQWGNRLNQDRRYSKCQKLQFGEGYMTNMCLKCFRNITGAEGWLFCAGSDHGAVVQRALWNWRYLTVDRKMTKIEEAIAPSEIYWLIVFY